MKVHIAIPVLIVLIVVSWFAYKNRAKIMSAVGQ